MWPGVALRGGQGFRDREAASATAAPGRDGPAPALALPCSCSFNPCPSACLWCVPQGTRPPRPPAQHSTAHLRTGCSSSAPASRLGRGALARAAFGFFFFGLAAPAPAPCSSLATSPGMPSSARRSRLRWMLQRRRQTAGQAGRHGRAGRVASLFCAPRGGRLGRCRQGTGAPQKYKGLRKHHS